MSFYQSIAEVYNQIFPLNPVQLQFITQSCKPAHKLSLLDIGCGTGLLSRALAGTYDKVVGIDLDDAMLARARASATLSPNLSFFQMDMMDMDGEFDAGAFDALVCFGNTLVHLPTVDHISLFFEKSFGLLFPKGKLLIQLINYDRILDQNIQSLPTLETEAIKFIRKYHHLTEQGLIEFETHLTIKKNLQIIRNTVRLLPVRRSELETRLKDAGFEHIQFFGNFKRDPLTAQSIPLVIEASKV